MLAVDLSPRLTAAARRGAGELPRRLAHRLAFSSGDAARVAREEPFDAVVSYLSLMHFPDPGRALAAWRGILAPGGRVVVVLPHPFTQTPGSRWLRTAPMVREAGQETWLGIEPGPYFESGRERFRFTRRFPALTENHHRSLGAWNELFRRAGLAWTRVDEPRPSAAQVRARPEWEPLRRVPYFLVIRAEPLR